MLIDSQLLFLGMSLAVQFQCVGECLIQSGNRVVAQMLDWYMDCFRNSIRRLFKRLQLSWQLRQWRKLLCFLLLWLDGQSCSKGLFNLSLCQGAGILDNLCIVLLACCLGQRSLQLSCRRLFVRCAVVVVCEQFALLHLGEQRFNSGSDLSFFGLQLFHSLIMRLFSELARFLDLVDKICEPACLLQMLHDRIEVRRSSRRHERVDSTVSAGHSLSSLAHHRHHSLSALSALAAHHRHHVSLATVSLLAIFVEQSTLATHHVALAAHRVALATLAAAHSRSTGHVAHCTCMAFWFVSVGAAFTPCLAYFGARIWVAGCLVVLVCMHAHLVHVRNSICLVHVLLHIVSKLLFIVVRIAADL